MPIKDKEVQRIYLRNHKRKTRQSKLYVSLTQDIPQEKLEGLKLGESMENKGQWKKGERGPGPGRQKGQGSPITEIKRMFREDPELFKSFVKGYMEDPTNRRHLVEMLDGKPKQQVDMDVKFPNTLIELIHGVTIETEDREISGEDTERPELLRGESVEQPALGETTGDTGGGQG